MRRLGSSRIMQDVSQAAISFPMDAGKSDPLSTIQDTVRDRGGGEKKRAPRAEKDPAPPNMSCTEGVGGR